MVPLPINHNLLPYTATLAVARGQIVKIVGPAMVAPCSLAGDRCDGVAVNDAAPGERVWSQRGGRAQVLAGAGGLLAGSPVTTDAFGHGVVAGLGMALLGIAAATGAPGEYLDVDVTCAPSPFAGIVNANIVTSLYGTGALLIGTVVYVSADDVVDAADATSIATARVIGVVFLAGEVAVKGKTVTRFEPGLVGPDTPAAGRVAYLTVGLPGRATTVAPTPADIGKVVVPVGVIANASGYAGGTCVVELTVPDTITR